MIRIPFLKRSANEKKPERRLLECVFCFDKNTFSAADIVGLAESNPAFKISFLEVYDDHVPFTEKEREKLMSTSPIQSERTAIKLLDESQTQSIHFLHPSHNEKPQVMHWVLDADNISVLDSAWLASLLAHDHFVVGYCADKDDMFMQSTKIYGLYQKRGIKPANTIRNEFGDLMVDISQNPGRRKLVRKMWLMSCWKMWFGKNFYSVVPKEKLLSFHQASSITQLDHDVISIELYPDAFRAADKHNRSVQKAFREWINMDQLEKDLS